MKYQSLNGFFALCFGLSFPVISAQQFGTYYNWYFVYPDTITPSSINMDKTMNFIFINGFYSSSTTNVVYTAELPLDGSMIFTREDGRDSYSSDIVQTVSVDSNGRFYPALKNSISSFFGRSFNLDGSNDTFTSDATFNDIFIDIIHDSDGGFALIGVVTSDGTKDASIYRYSSDGSFLWNYQSYSAENNRISFALIHPLNSSIIYALSEINTNQFQLLMIINDSPAIVLSTFGYVTFNNGPFDADLALDIDQGYLYVCGSSDKTFDTQTSNYIGYIAQFNISTGSLITYVMIDGSSSTVESIGKCVIDPQSKDVIAAGQTTGNVVPDYRSQMDTDRDLFLVRYSSAMNSTGASQYGSSSATSESFYDFALDSQNSNINLLFKSQGGIFGIPLNDGGVYADYLIQFPLYHVENVIAPNYTTYVGPTVSNVTLTSISSTPSSSAVSLTVNPTPSSDIFTSSDFSYSSESCSFMTGCGASTSGGSGDDSSDASAQVQIIIDKYLWYIAAAIGVIFFLIASLCTWCICGRKRKFKEKDYADESSYAGAVIDRSYASSSAYNNVGHTTMPLYKPDENFIGVRPRDNFGDSSRPLAMEGDRQVDDSQANLDELDALAAGLNENFKL